RLRRRHGRAARGPRDRLPARLAARARAVRARGRGQAALPRRSRVRIRLPREAAPDRGLALRAGRRSAARARPADGADDREQLRADGPSGPRRLGDGGGAPPRAGGAPAGARPGLPRPRGGDAGVRMVRTIRDVRGVLAPLREGVVGLVPTMGAFHGGHLALFRAARDECDTVVASLFVNPAQFAEAADLDAYPRDEERDRAVAEEAGVDVLFAPPVEEMYPEGFQTWVEVEQLGSILEGAARPGHFRAVATVCCKLFNIVRPRRAYFGQKDAQQVEVVRRLVRDLDLELELRVVETVRDADGLALSSRNAQLSLEERARALALPRALATRHPERARELLAGLDVDYVE